MFNTDEFIAALENGTDPDAIAKAFTDTLNTAVKQKKEADAKAAAEAKAKKDAEEKAALARAKRLNDLDDIIDLIADFISEYYPDMYDKDLKIDSEEVDKAIQDAYKSVKDMNRLIKSLDNFEKAYNKSTKSVKTKSADDAINDFFKKYGL